MSDEIDQHIAAVEGGRVYIEVKTVRPVSKDTEERWRKYEERQVRHTEGVNFIVDKAWLGAEIYGNSFSARSKFLEYTREFEVRFAAASREQPGRGVLVFCGAGME